MVASPRKTSLYNVIYSTVCLLLNTSAKTHQVSSPCHGIWHPTDLGGWNQTSREWHDCTSCHMLLQTRSVTKIVKCKQNSQVKSIQSTSLSNKYIQIHLTEPQNAFRPFCPIPLHKSLKLFTLSYLKLCNTLKFTDLLLLLSITFFQLGALSS